MHAASRRLAGAPGRALLPSRRCGILPPTPKPAIVWAVPEAAGAPPQPQPAPPSLSAAPSTRSSRRTPAFRPSPDALASTRPLILLCGWLGCRPRDLDKYGVAWRELGHDTLAAAPTLAPLLWPPSAEAAAERLESATLAALATRPNPSVILHAFSNGGFYAAGALLERKSPALALPSRLVGLAFDSCPARLDPDLAARGVTAAMLGEAAGGRGEGRRKAVTSLLRPVLGGLLSSPASPLGGRVEAAWAAWGGLAGSLPPGLPRLFLYSDADALIPAAEVEAWAGVMGWEESSRGRARAAAVTMRRFPGSPHCEHLRSDPDGYRAALAGLAERAGRFRGDGLAAAAAAAA